MAAKSSIDENWHKIKFTPLQLVVVDSLPRDGIFPFKEGEHLIYLGEIVQMPGHVIVVDRRGLTHFGYHDNYFRDPTEEEL